MKRLILSFLSLQQQVFYGAPSLLQYPGEEGIQYPGDVHGANALVGETILNK